ncbi:MAG: hypothetical protein ACRDJE_24890 [Dehalococcoidia bacterium]
MTRFWIPAALILLAAATLLACGGDATDDTTTSSGTTDATAAGTKLSDCDYATALLTALETFSTSVPSVTTITNKEEALTAFDTFDGELGRLVGELKSYQLSSDVAKVNREVVAILEDARTQIPELKRAVESGDTARLTTVGVTLSQGIVPRMEAIEKDNQGAMDKLNQCDGA